MNYKKLTDAAVASEVSISNNLVLNVDGEVKQASVGEVLNMSGRKSVTGLEFEDYDNWSRGNVEPNGSFTPGTTRISSDYMILSEIIKKSDGDVCSIS